MATRLRDLDPSEDPRPTARRTNRLRPAEAPGLLQALTALETIEQAMQDPARLAGSLTAVRAALGVVRQTLREHDRPRAPEPSPTATQQPAAPGLEEVAGLEGLLGRSPAWQRVLKVVARVADSPVTVLIEGESGTGKEVLARVVHRASKLVNRPFVAVNCGALPGPLLEAELFGHTKGAFTGAVTARKGRFKEADGGTLFLDEIGEIPVEVQAKLLRALQSGEIQRLGQDKAEKVEVRVLAATNRDLEAMSAEGQFREDLFYRLAAIRLQLPPLRERHEELLPMLEHFLQRYGQAWGRPVPRLAPDAIAALEAYRFPGNIRELENVAKHLVLLSGEEARKEHLPPAVLRGSDGLGPGAPAGIPQDHDQLVAAKDAAVARVERAFIEAALARCDGNVSRAARETGMNRAYLQRLVQEHLGADR